MSRAGPAELPPDTVLPDPTESSRRRRRRWILTSAAGLAAVVLAVAATVVIVHLWKGSGTVEVNEPGQTTRPRSNPPPAPAGAAVSASALYSDPVFVDANYGYALAHTPIEGQVVERLVLSTDGGVSWRIAGSPFPVAGQFTTILFTSLTSGYVFGPAGLMVTHDGGASWTQAPLAGEVQRVIPYAGSTWAILTHCAGAPGTNPPCPVSLYITADGRHWRQTSAPPPIEESARGGAVLGRVGPEAGYLLTWGAPGSGLAFTDDAGASWQRLPDPCGTDVGSAGAGAGSFGMEDLAAPGGGQLWLVCGAAPTSLGQPKSVYRSQDGGRHWILTASTGLAPGAEQPTGRIPYQGEVSQLATVDPLIAWLGLSRVGVIETVDGGRIWYRVQGIGLVPDSPQVGVTFIQTVTAPGSPAPQCGQICDGWALAFGVGVWRTTDAVHWHRVSRPAA